MSSLNVLVSKNFKDAQMRSFTDYEFKNICSLPDTCFDSRTYMISTDTDLNSMEWYFNYLTTISEMARQHPDAYPTYLLDLGYIPIVYLPTCLTSLSAVMHSVLNTAALPYISIKTTSFNRSFVPSDTYDLWVHKMDISRKFDIDLGDIRSSDIARRLYDR